MAAIWLDHQLRPDAMPRTAQAAARPPVARASTRYTALAMATVPKASAELSPWVDSWAWLRNTGGTATRSPARMANGPAPARRAMNQTDQAHRTAMTADAIRRASVEGPKSQNASAAG